MLARRKSTGVITGPLLTRPTLKPQDHEYMVFYDTLAEARSMGMSAPNPIPTSEVVALLSLLGIASATAKAKYLRFTRILDSVYREHWHDNQLKNP